YSMLSTSGFFSAAAPLTGAADSGTRLQFTFNIPDAANAPDSFQIWTPTNINSRSGLRAVLVRDAAGPMVALPPTDAASGLYSPPISSGRATVNYEITSTNSFNRQDFRLRFEFRYNRDYPPSQDITVAVGLTPQRDQVNAVERYAAMYDPVYIFFANL